MPSNYSKIVCYFCKRKISKIGESIVVIKIERWWSFTSSKVLRNSCYRIPVICRSWPAIHLFFFPCCCCRHIRCCHYRPLLLPLPTRHHRCCPIRYRCHRQHAVCPRQHRFTRHSTTIIKLFVVAKPIVRRPASTISRRSYFQLAD